MLVKRAAGPTQVDEQSRRGNENDGDSETGQEAPQPQVGLVIRGGMKGREGCAPRRGKRQEPCEA
jgi:hypothetical protein